MDAGPYPQSEAKRKATRKQPSRRGTSQRGRRSGPSKHWTSRRRLSSACSPGTRTP